MNKYTKPTVEIVELSVKESLSALNLPQGFSATTKKIGGTNATFKNVTIYKSTSQVTGA